MYKDKPARLVLANDITEKLRAEAELAQQRTLQQKMNTEIGIKAQEKEREEIGKELHDNICQIMATAKLYLEFAMKKRGFRSEELEKSRENINLTISEIRKLSHTLVAPSLRNFTLIQVIQRLLGDIQATSSLQPELITENYEENAMDHNMKLMFYRIAQEQMNNILKHSKASKAIVKISITDNDICLSIKDDGAGFDTGKISTGIGLRNMTNRVNFYDGTIQIGSSPGKGCILEVTIPVKKT
jgi:two-component system, NarL family, sensor histidine kinase UhpB